MPILNQIITIKHKFDQLNEHQNSLNDKIITEGGKSEKPMELSIEGDFDLIQNNESKETKIIIPNPNKTTSTDTITIQIKGEESIKNTHESGKYELLEDANTGRRNFHQIREKNYSNKEISKSNNCKLN